MDRGDRDDGCGAGFARYMTVGEEAADQHAALIRQRDDDADLPSCRIGNGIDARHATGEAAVRISVDGEVHGSTEANVGQLIGRH